MVVEDCKFDSDECLVATLSKSRYDSAMTKTYMTGPIEMKGEVAFSTNQMFSSERVNDRQVGRNCLLLFFRAVHFRYFILRILIELN